MIELKDIPNWTLSETGKEIERSWVVRDFGTACDFLNRIATIAESEGHHPDFHLTNYRHVRVVLSTHETGGLTEKDFIIASKIDQLPVAPRRKGLDAARF